MKLNGMLNMGIYLKIWNEHRTVLNFKMPYTLEGIEKVIGCRMQMDKEYSINHKELESIMDFYGEMSMKIPNTSWVKSDIVNGLINPLLTEWAYPTTKKEYIVKIH